MAKQIVSFFGERKMGKDTAGSILKNKFGFVHVALASQMKKDVSKVFNVGPIYMHDQGLKDSVQPCLTLANCSDSEFLKEARALLTAHRQGQSVEMHTPLSPREVMQVYATWKRDRFGPEVYLKATIEEIMNCPVGTRIVITDLRTPSEYKALCDLSESGFNAKFVKVVCQGRPLEMEETVVGSDLHALEHDWKKFRTDHVVTNVWGDLGALEDELEAVVLSCPVLKSEVSPSFSA